MAAPKMAMAVAQPVATVPVAKAAPKPAVAVAVAAAPAGKGSAAPVAAVAQPAASSAASAEEGDVDAKLIMDCPVTKIYLLTNGSKKLVESGTMQVLMVDPDGVKGNEDDVYILLAGGFKLALRMYVPCLEMAPRNFVFPTDDKTYGIILADTIHDDVLDVFRVMLQEHTSFRTAETPQNIEELPDTVEKVTTVANSVAAGLGAGSVVVATGVIKGGKMVGSLVMKGGNYLTTKLNRNKEATKVSEEHKARLQKAKFVSGAAVKVSKALVIGAMATTQVMAHQLSEAIKETDIGKKIAAEPEVPNANLEAAKVVGKATIGAVLNVYQAMETAVFGVAHDVSAATVTVVTHKYGEEAGIHTKESLGVVENVAVAAHGMKQLGVKSIAKATAIKTGQEVLTTDAERAEEAQRKADALAAAGPAGQMRAGLGAAMGLPEGIDPMLAMEAMQSVAVLKAAAAGMGAGHQGDTVTTATATGPTPAAAHAAASAAAHAAAPHHH